MPLVESGFLRRPDANAYQGDGALATAVPAELPPPTLLARDGPISAIDPATSGGLDRSQTTLSRSFGFSWSLGGWLLTPFLAKAGLEKSMQLRARVAAEIKTTFASHYSEEISLAPVLSLDAIGR